MKIKILCDYIGRETQMKLVSADTIIEAEHATALELIRIGVAVEHEEKPAKKEKVKHEDA